jgi:hypothetical protein
VPVAREIRLNIYPTERKGIINLEEQEMNLFHDISWEEEGGNNGGATKYRG